MSRSPNTSQDPVTARLGKATALHRAGKLAAADAEYRRVLKRAPGHALALNGRAMVAHARGRPALALDLLRKIGASMRDDPGYLMNLGTVQTANQLWDAAAQSFRAAIGLQPGYPDPYYNLGDLYLQTGRPDAAIDVFDACMAARGRDFHALAYKAHALLDAGRADEAGRLLDYEQLVQRYDFSEQVEPLADFNDRLAHWLEHHPSLQKNAMSTRGGQHTGELATGDEELWREVEALIRMAVIWYADRLSVATDHPMARWAPQSWSLTAWGVVMQKGGHERSHIHPNGWLSGVMYLQLPQLIDQPQRNPEGWLEFGRPTPELHLATPPQTLHYQPRYGEMLLFPSYFYHGTVPYQADETRICLAFDVQPPSNG